MTWQINFLFILHALLIRRESGNIFLFLYVTLKMFKAVIQCFQEKNYFNKFHDIFCLTPSEVGITTLGYIYWMPTVCQGLCNPCNTLCWDSNDIISQMTNVRFWELTQLGRIQIQTHGSKSYYSAHLYLPRTKCK